MTYNPDDYTQYDDDYDKAPEPEGGFRDVPKGVYQAYVDKVEIAPPGEWSDYPKLKLQCKIIGGDYAGAVLFPDGSFDPEWIQYLKGMIVKMGLGEDVKRASDIPGCLPMMLDRVLDVAVVPRKSDPSKFNHYVNRFVRMLDKAGDTGEPPPHDDSEIPF